MLIRFREAGNHKVGHRVVDVKPGEILDVSASDIERYTDGEHYDRVDVAEPAPAEPAEPAAPAEPAQGESKSKGSKSKGTE